MRINFYKFSTIRPIHSLFGLGEEVVKLAPDKNYSVRSSSRVAGRRMRVEIAGQVIDVDKFGVYFPNFPKEYKQVWEWEEVIRILAKESKKWREVRGKKCQDQNS